MLPPENDHSSGYRLVQRTGSCRSGPTARPNRVCLSRARERRALSISTSCQISRVGYLPSMVYSDKISWSPDGQSSSFSFRDGNETENIIVSDLKTKRGTMITTPEQQVFHTFPHWSPDGSRLCLSWREGNSQIILLDLSTGEMRQITDIRGQNEMPDWSSDGARIVFSSNGDIATVDSEGGTVTTVTSGAMKFMHPTWSPDGIPHRNAQHRRRYLGCHSGYSGTLTQITNDLRRIDTPHGLPIPSLSHFNRFGTINRTSTLLRWMGQMSCYLLHWQATNSYWLPREVSRRSELRAPGAYPCPSPATTSNGSHCLKYPARSCRCRCSCRPFRPAWTSRAGT